MDFRSITIIIALFALSSAGLTVGVNAETRVFAGNILKQIEEGESVNLNDVIIEGDLDLKKLENLSIISSIRICNSTINGTIDFQNKILENEFYIYDTIIKDKANFRGTQFNEDINVKRSRFYKNIDFRGSKFKGNASFWESQFNRTADFSDSTFRDHASFWHDQFRGYTSFFESQFNKTIDFSRSSFNEYSDFTGSHFNGSADFRWSLFCNETLFTHAKFNDIANFSKSQFKADANFKSSLFNHIADFNNAQFSGNIDFKGSRFNDIVDLSQSRFDKAVFFGDSDFLGSLILTRATFGHFDIYWTHSNRLICDDGPTYLALIKNFKDLEQFEAADDVYYQYREWRYSRNSGWSKVIDYLACLSCGYGIRPMRPISCAIIILFLFGFIYKFYRMARSVNAGTNQSLMISLAFSTVALFSLPRELYPYGDECYLKFIRQGINLKLMGRSIRIPLVQSLVFCERLIGWILLILFINSLSRVMIRY